MKEKCKGDLWKVRWSTPWLSYETFIIDAELCWTHSWGSENKCGLKIPNTTNGI